MKEHTRKAKERTKEKKNANFESFQFSNWYLGAVCYLFIIDGENRTDSEFDFPDS